MAYCPACKTDWENDVTECPVCGAELSTNNNDGVDEWVLLGMIEDKLSADFAEETLKTYEIPVVIISRSGFFGNIGLPLNPLYSTKSPAFEIRVPASHTKEAVGILDMALGEKWQRKED